MAPGLIISVKIKLKPTEILETLVHVYWYKLH